VHFKLWQGHNEEHIVMGGDEMPTEGESIDMRDIDERVPCASKNTLTMMDLY
jgi:hypothetical protein